MHCTNCNTEFVSGAAFCPSCGTSISAQTPVEPVPVQVVPHVPIPPKGKSKMPIIIGVIVAVVIIIVVIASLGGGNGGIDFDIGGGRTTTDYVLTVRQLSPFEDFDINLDYGAAFTRFMTSVRWSERPQSDGSAFVDATGNLADIGGTNINVTVTFRLTPVEGREDFYFIEPILLEMNDRLFGAEAANYLVVNMFSAYDGSFDSVAEYYASYGLTSIFDYIRTNFN